MSLITHDGKIVTVDGKGLTFDQLRSELDTANGSESVTLAEAVENTEQAKTDIASAITAKGGTVGASDGLEDFPSAIAGIPSGGGNLNYYEERTFTSDASSITVTHNLGTRKVLFAVTAVGTFAATAGYQTQVIYGVTLSELTGESGFDVDYSAYHPTYSGATRFNYAGHEHIHGRSPWTSQSTPYQAGREYGSITINSKNEIVIKGLNIPAGNTYAIFVVGVM